MQDYRRCTASQPTKEHNSPSADATFVQNLRTLYPPFSVQSQIKERFREHCGGPSRQQQQQQQRG